MKKKTIILILLVTIILIVLDLTGLLWKFISFVLDTPWIMYPVIALITILLVKATFFPSKKNQQIRP